MLCQSISRISLAVRMLLNLHNLLGSGFSRAVKRGQWRGSATILKGSQSSSRAEFFNVAEPQKGVHAEERGGCQVVKGAGLRTLSRRCSRVRLPSPALKKLYNLSYSRYERSPERCAKIKEIDGRLAIH